MVDTGRIISDAQSTLVRRTLGGVTEDSANKAIEKAATETDAAAQKEIKKAQEALDAKGRALVEMQGKNSELEKANRTLKDDRDSLRGENEKLNKTLENRPRTREGKPRALPNGNTETIKTNSNGARMTIERTPEGKTVSYAVENIDGDVRKTTLDPTTGKPIETFDNTNGEDTKFEYTPNGVKMTRLNAEEETPETPKMIKKGEYIEDRDGCKVFKNVYSDGSYDMVYVSISDPNAVTIHKCNSKGLQIGTDSKCCDHGYEIQKSSIIDPEVNRVSSTEYIRKFLKTGEIEYKEEKKYNSDGKCVEDVRTYKNGMKRICKAEVNEYGMTVNHDNPSLEYIYPEDSKIDKSRLIYRGQYDVDKEILTLKDGTEVIVKINGDYQNIGATVKKQGQAPVELSYDEMNKYLADIGKITRYGTRWAPDIPELRQIYFLNDLDR